MTTDLVQLDATAQAELVRRGEATPLELVEAAIARIEAVNPQLNAVITPLFDKARAGAASAALPDGPFRGVPFLLKDLGCHSAGDPYHEGLRFLRDLNWVAEQDTYMAAKLRQAGFVFVGKTNTPELAILPTTEPEALRPDPQSVGYRPLAGRVERWLGGGGCRRHGSRRARQRRRRLDSYSGQRLRAGRA